MHDIRFARFNRQIGGLPSGPVSFTAAHVVGEATGTCGNILTIYLCIRIGIGRIKRVESVILKCNGVPRIRGDRRRRIDLQLDGIVLRGTGLLLLYRDDDRIFQPVLIHAGNRGEAIAEPHLHLTQRRIVVMDIRIGEPEVFRRERPEGIAVDRDIDGIKVDDVGVRRRRIERVGKRILAFPGDDVGIFLRPLALDRIDLGHNDGVGRARRELRAELIDIRRVGGELPRCKEAVLTEAERIFLSGDGDHGIHALAIRTEGIEPALRRLERIVEADGIIGNAHDKVFHQGVRISCSRTERAVGNAEANRDLRRAAVGQAEIRPPIGVVFIVLLRFGLEAELGAVVCLILLIIKHCGSRRTVDGNFVPSVPVGTQVCRTVCRDGDLIETVAIEPCRLTCLAAISNFRRIRLIIIAGNEPVVFCVHCTLVDAHGAHIAGIALQEETKFFGDADDAVPVAGARILRNEAVRIDFEDVCVRIHIGNIRVDRIGVGLRIDGTGNVKVLVARHFCGGEACIHITGCAVQLGEQVRTVHRTDTIVTVLVQNKFRRTIERNARKKPLRRLVHFRKVRYRNDDLVLLRCGRGIADSLQCELQFHGKRDVLACKRNTEGVRRRTKICRVLLTDFKLQDRRIGDHVARFIHRAALCKIERTHGSFIGGVLLHSQVNAFRQVQSDAVSARSRRLEGVEVLGRIFFVKEDVIGIGSAERVHWNAHRCGKPELVGHDRIDHGEIAIVTARARFLQHDPAVLVVRSDLVARILISGRRRNADLVTINALLCLTGENERCNAVCIGRCIVRYVVPGFPCLIVRHKRNTQNCALDRVAVLIHNGIGVGERCTCSIIDDKRVVVHPFRRRYILIHCLGILRNDGIPLRLIDLDVIGRGGTGKCRHAVRIRRDRQIASAVQRTQLYLNSGQLIACRICYRYVVRRRFGLGDRIAAVTGILAWRASREHRAEQRKTEQHTDKQRCFQSFAHKLPPKIFSLTARRREKFN